MGRKANRSPSMSMSSLRNYKRSAAPLSRSSPMVERCHAHISRRTTPESTDQETVEPALQLGFIGKYDPEEDDFVGRTIFCSPTVETGEQAAFRTPHKRQFGFLFLRTVRTGSKPLSLERGYSLMSSCDFKRNVFRCGRTCWLSSGNYRPPQSQSSGSRRFYLQSGMLYENSSPPSGRMGRTCASPISHEKACGAY